jgi:hypothetical protein
MEKLRKTNENIPLKVVAMKFNKVEVSPWEEEDGLETPNLSH